MARHQLVVRERLLDVPGNAVQLVVDSRHPSAVGGGIPGVPLDDAEDRELRIDRTAGMEAADRCGEVLEHAGRDELGGRGRMSRDQLGDQRADIWELGVHRRRQAERGRSP